MDWSDVRYFLEVSREGTLSGAARRLKVDQTTVARRLKTLEDTLGTKLFERTPDGLVLTSAGEAIRAASLHMEEAAVALERVASGVDARPEGTVRLTSTDLLGAWLVVPALQALRTSHPGIHFELVTSVHVLDIARREADVAVRLGRPRGEQLVVRKLGTLGYSLYATRAYLAAHPVGTPGEGLVGHDVAGYDEKVHPPADLRLAGVSVREAHFTLRTNSPLALLSAVGAGFGVGELACYYGDRHPDLVRVWPALPPHQVDVWFVVHADLQRTRRVRVVMDALREAFEREGPALRGEQPREDPPLLRPPLPSPGTHESR